MDVFSNGNRQFKVIVTDVSGAGVSNYANDVNVYAELNGNSVASSVTEITGGNISGLYDVDINFANTGNGYVSYTITDDDIYDISPDVEYFIVTEYDNDNVFNLVKSQSNLPSETRPGGNYSRVYETVKLNDGYIQTFNINATEMRQDSADLTGWTNFTFEIYSTDSATTSGSLLFTGTTNVDSLTDPSTVSVEVPSISGDLIPTGFNNIKLYADLSGDNPDGIKITMKEIVLTITREYTDR